MRGRAQQMNIIDQYKSLPESNVAPDAVWVAHKTAERIAELEWLLAAEKNQLTADMAEMRKVLSRDWSSEEITTAFPTL